METWAISVLLACLTTLATAHYQGYPFIHMNEGRYGADFKVANYKNGQKPYIPPMKVSIDINGKNFAFVPANKQRKMEFDFRHVNGFPVHMGNGQFYFLGNFKGKCEDNDQAGFYFTSDSKSYMVCENRRAHRFECPNGTRNRKASYFQYNHTYDHSDLCSEHDNTAESTESVHAPEPTEQEVAEESSYGAPSDTPHP